MRRTIATTARQSSRHIRDVLQSALVTELIAPSRRLWLVSAWISDSAVIDNRGGEFAALVPAWPEREIRLSEVLAQFLASGATVTVATNDHHANRAFHEALHTAASAQAATGNLKLKGIDRLRADKEPGLHRKRLVTDHFVIWGSMNFTFSGFERNSEDVHFDTAADVVAAAINEMVQLHPERTP